MKRCLSCGVCLQGTHHNRRWCVPCANAKKYRPAHGLSAAQQQIVLEMHTRAELTDIAAAAGASVTSVSRYRCAHRLSHRQKRYSAELKAAVASYYEQHGAADTKKQYPHVCLSSIIRSTPHALRTRRWSDEDIRQAASMAGIVSEVVQARIFDRRTSHSINTMWGKRLTRGMRSLHGLRRHHADYLCRPGYPTVATVVVNRQGEMCGSRPLLLWCEAGQWLQAWVAPFLHEAIEAMAQFQRWLLGSDDPAAQFRAMQASCGAGSC